MQFIFTNLWHLSDIFNLKNQVEGYILLKKMIDKMNLLREIGLGKSIEIFKLKISNWKVQAEKINLKNSSFSLGLKNLQVWKYSSWKITCPETQIFKLKISSWN